MTYVVTAHHNLEESCNLSGTSEIPLRLNTESGFEFINTELVDWRLNRTTDVAILPWDSAESDFEVTYILLDENMAATGALLDKMNIGIGDEVFITGLFVHHTGSRKNQPIVRIGNIALLAEEPLRTEVGDIEGHLIEVRSLGGLSGSPVFAHLPAFYTEDGVAKAREKSMFFLLEKFMVIGISERRKMLRLRVMFPNQ